eukprot:TRINITY_DN11851_c0_g1_i1.p1 TRINITY_DN11851_c0_g1~~TRINITY_DN11851_c0_g1_i1.p1  ORF type:complete len:326 (+),score=35.51 TRINITY_DN11851_c0_g1_i1:46-1023(+)
MEKEDLIARELHEYGVCASEVRPLDSGGKLSTTFEVVKSSKHERLIVKTAPSDDFAKELCSKMNLFQREKRFYDVSSEWRTSQFIIPKYLKCTSPSSTDIIALEHLGEWGFQPCQLSTPLSLEFAKICVKAIANFHLESTKLGNDLFTGVFPSDDDGIAFATMIFDLGVADLKSRSAFLPSEVVSKIESSRDYIIGTITPPVDTTEPMAVIHGDCWLPNFMTKGTSEIALLDFQWVMVDYPAVDLFVLLFTGLCAEDRRRYFEELVAIYCKEFGCKEFSRETKKRAASRAVLVMIAGGVHVFVDDTTPELQERCREALIDLVAFL